MSNIAGHPTKYDLVTLKNLRRRAEISALEEKGRGRHFHFLERQREFRALDKAVDALSKALAGSSAPTPDAGPGPGLTPNPSIKEGGK